MVTINKVYTKTGDDGETSLGNFERVPKYDLRVEAYGTVDELNSHIGIARLVSTGDMSAKLSVIQNDLFDLGADLCRPNMEKDEEAEYEVLRMVRSQVDRLEHEIDIMNEPIAPLKTFILPGGSQLAAHLHVCRTVTRRAERLAVELAFRNHVNPEATKYLNRLSDWFFVAARAANNNGADDLKWVPGANR
tara:strand:- start:158 stop:730 length:573 start_codon:yes stop_codon:yes gene_type:complete